MAKNFESDNHALVTGQILGLLMREHLVFSDMVNVRPGIDSDGDYTRTIHFDIGDRSYWIAVNEEYGDGSVPKAMGTK